MTRAPALAVLVAALALAAAPPTGASSGDGYTHCSSRIGTDGFWNDIRVRGVRCLDGAHIARRWVSAIPAHTYAKAPKVKRIGSWTCRLEILGADENPYGRVTCSHGSRRVRFYGTS